MAFESLVSPNVHIIQDRNHNARASKAHKDMTAYRRWVPRDHSRYDVVANDLVHGVGSGQIK